MYGVRNTDCGELSNDGGITAVLVAVCEEIDAQISAVFLFTYYLVSMSVDYAPRAESFSYFA